MIESFAAQDSSRTASRIAARRLALLFAAALVFHCLGNWALPLIDRDEPRFAEASREMLQRGDYVVPFFNGRERFDKPPLIYWLQCASYRVLGENEFAARLPAAISAALLAVALAAWGARLFDPAAGWRAAIVFTTCMQTLIHARGAVADMTMVLFVTLAAWAGWEWHRAASTGAGARHEWGFALALGGSLGLGFLAKGPIALFPLGMLWWSGLPRVASPRRHALQWACVLLLALGIVAWWGIPALVRTHGEFARIGLGKHVVARSLAPLEGHGGGSMWGYLAALPFFFLTIWGTFFPWSIWLAGVTRHAFARAAACGSIERYLFVGSLLCVGIFTLVRTKLPHYILPAFPFLALLVAAWWRDANRPAETFRRTAVASVAICIVLFLAGIPLAAMLFPTERLYRQAAPFLRRNMAFASVEYDEPSLIWIFRRSVDAFREKVDEDELAEWLAKPGPRFVVLTEPALARLHPPPDPAWKVLHVAGWHAVKGRIVRLALIVKP